MRIIAGSLKGRRLKAPTWDGLRPTSDKVRETLFNVLAPRLAGARVLDGFAGTGAIGIEAISRGAREVVFIEADRRARALVEANLAHCGVQTGYTVVGGSVARALHALAATPGFVPFDIVVFDPPYDAAPAETLAGADAVMAPGGVLVLEHRRKETPPESSGRLIRVRQIASGDSELTFYQVGELPAK
ncbi:MAG: 16S rRNA (guanine(966)-N(2))-methyltransferase RsmD [Acidobacteria bacterium RIFCSPLOWO2_02_FULL_65_29]|nr:MAG: 16S rRNA (guanine(966)-N(2))-methyltransferase RsmD [Acidobacteria bacterium RIFCSPLOWO2_02_FULL_65_29]